MIKTELTGRLVAVLVTALIVTSVFSGAVSARDSVASSNRNPDNKTQVIPEGNRCDESTTKNAVTANLNLSERIDELLAEGKLPFLFFYADWCGFCEKHKPIIEELEKEYADSVVFIWLNVEEYEEEAQEFGVSGYPTMFLIVGKTEEGYQYKRFGGYTEKDVLNIQQIALNSKNIPAWISVALLRVPECADLIASPPLCILCILLQLGSTEPLEECSIRGVAFDCDANHAQAEVSAVRPSNTVSSDLLYACRKKCLTVPYDPQVCFDSCMCDPHEDTTDPDGTFHFRVSRSGLYEIRARQIINEMETINSGTGEVVVDCNGPSDVIITLYPEYIYILGVVTDKNGEGIPFVSIKFTNGFSSKSTSTNEEGFYKITLRARVDYDLRVSSSHNNGILEIIADNYMDKSLDISINGCNNIEKNVELTLLKEKSEICDSHDECKSNYCASPCTGESKHCCNPGQHWSGTQCVDYCICQDDSECPPHCYVCDGYKCVVDNTKDKGEGKCCGDGYFFEGPNACCDNTDCDVDNGYACSNHKCLLVDTKICTEDSQCISQNCASCEGVPEKRCCPVGMMWNGAECVESCTSCPDMCYPSNINYRLFDGYPYSYGRGYDGANCPKNHNSVIDLDGDGNYDCCYLKEKCDTGQCYDGKCPSEDERRSCEEFVVTGPLFSESGGNTSGMECRHGVQLSGKPDNTRGHLKCPAGKICYTFDRNLFYSQCEECECGCDTPLFPNRCKKDCGVPDGVCHESRCGPDTLPKFDTYDQVRNNRTYTERYIESCEPSSDTGMRKYYDYEFCRSSPLNEEPEETNENLWRPEIKTYDMNCYDGGDTKEEMYRLKAGCKPPIPDDFWMCGQYGSSPRCYNPEVYECCAGSDLVKKDQDGDGVQDHMCCIDEIKGRWCVGDVPADSQKVIDFAGKNIMEDEQNCGGCGSKCTKWVEGACYEYEVDQNFRCGRETPQCCNGVCTEPKPDLSVKKIAFYPEILIDGNSVMVLVTVKRMDEFYSENILTDNVTVELYIDEILKDNTTTTILPDSSQAVILFWNANVSAGEHEVRISIDTNDTVDECNEKNNDLTKTIIVNKKPDLTFNDRIDTFSDGSKEKLLKWNSAGDKTVYIKLPKNAKVEKASLDISYKEETTETSRSLETYCSRRCVRAGESVWCNAPDVVKTVDPGDGGLYNFTVYTPNCNPNYGDTIEYKVTCHGGDGGTYDGCGKKFNFKCTKVSFKVDCSGWHPCHGSARYYAECGIGANPQITYETLPTTNPSLNIDGDDIWYYEGEFNTTETVPDFSKEIQTYLDNCSPDGR